jgi:hypothetical protein
MSDPERTDSRTQPPAGGDRRPLDRAPGERYGGSRGPGPGSQQGSGPGPRRAKALVAAVLVAGAGAALFFLLGLLDLGIGLVAVAAFTGWATALALVWWGRDALPAARTRVAIGALLGGWSVVGGILLDWLYALVQGGVLGPLEYVAQRYGPVALLALVVGVGIAAFRAR